MLMATAERNTVGSSTSRSGDGYSDTSGWVWFAAIMLIVAGIMRFFDAIWAFTYKGPVSENLQNAIFGHSLKTYGWVWLAVAVVLFLSGIGVTTRNQVARWIGVVAGAIAAISAIWWMPYYPVWSLMYVGVGVAVVYGLIAHAKPVD
jgi:hypothetical protein